MTAASGRRLIVCADDYGLTAATSDAILRAYRAGSVTATSVLVTAPAAAEALDRLHDAPGLEVGLHLALVGEDPPCSPASSIPTLVDRRGRLAASWRQLLPRLSIGRVDPDDVRRELDAQLAVLHAAGLHPTHLNAHQHLQLWGTVGTVVVEAATRHGIGYVRTPRSATWWRARAIGRLADRLHDAVRAAGLATSDGFAGLDEAGAVGTADLEAACTFGGTIELNVHPGPVVDPDRHRYAWGYRWGEELAALAALPTLAAQRGVELVGPSAVRPADQGRPGGAT